MDLLRNQTPPRWWSPGLSPIWFRIWRPLRWYLRLHRIRIPQIEIRGEEHLRQALSQNCGILIAPNHSSHADPFTICTVSEQIGKPFYYMVAWEVFVRHGWYWQQFLRQHGCFSVDREGTDMQAFRAAVEILQTRRNPLVIFPEGNIYHVNDRVTPFRDGPAAIALTAQKRSDRSVLCIPCGIKYQYLDDPIPLLLELMDRLEREILWRPRPDLPLIQRIYRFAEAALGLKELEYLGQVRTGPLPERIAFLRESVLVRLETQYKTAVENATLPVRVKMCRREAIRQLEGSHGSAQEAVRVDLDDLFLVTQLFSYPGDYVASKPSLERIAETFDKFEEDIFKKPSATVRGTRKAIVAFGPPIPITTPADKKRGIPALTEAMEKSVQGL
ncbi:MAG: 1-acyl-sn-glycerol-3-phosphate acyltransferase, partial [Phycisphaerae bacterium]|nr:1-acyl-sn-glycerol-3-phosphate acyltransferase [Phycisphaerae bacterium]